MMRLLKIGIAVFALFECAEPRLDNKLEELEDTCQPVTPEGHLSPNVQIQTLSPEFLDKYNEIIIIGDVHGCYDEQQAFLKRHNLYNDTVLKIYTGDLTAKGPKSLEVVRFVKNCSSCLSVRGNNDEKTLLRYYRTQHDSSFHLKPGTEFIGNMTQDDYEWLREVPYSLYLPSMNARVVHAGYLPGIPVEDNRPYTLMNLRTVIPAEECPGGWQVTRKEFLGKDRYPWASQWRGPEHIYFGHDNKRHLQLYPYATGVDTACVRGRYMTGIFIKGPRNGTFVTQTAFRQYYAS